VAYSRPMGTQPLAQSPDLVAELLDLIAATTKVENVDDALQAITQAALRLLPGDHASIRLLDPSQRELLASARAGRGTHLGSLPLARNAGVVGWVLEHGEAARIDDVRKDERFLAAMGQGFQIKSMLAEPLWSGGRVAGVLSVSAPEAAAFKVSDQLVARLLAACAMPLLERARRAEVAPFDELTLASTAESVRPRIEAEIARLRGTSRRFSVAVLALDSFASTVTAYGREVADRVLCVVSDRIRASVRVFDGFARSGESEFTLILTGQTEERARAACETARIAIGQPMEPLEGAFLSVTASVGLATWDELEKPDQLEARARRALGDARAAGGDQLAFG
jgi:two-component system cell cycle response regulator